MEDENQQADPWNIPGANPSFRKEKEEEGNFYFSAADLGTMSMVFGILSFFFYKGPFAILGLVLGIISRRKQQNSNAMVGIVCSIINLVLMAFGFIVVCSLVAAAIPALGHIFEELREAVNEW